MKILVALLSAIELCTGSVEPGAIFLVQAKGCVGRPPARNLTGFNLRTTDVPSSVGIVPGILTALHGVVGCSDIKAQSEDGPILGRPVRIIRVDVEHDVALLSSDEFVSKYRGGLAIRRGPVTPRTKLRVVGYPLNVIDQSIDSSLSLRQPATRQLFTLLSPSLQQSLTSRGSPNPRIIVLSIEGHILPGDSGAPVLDEEDHVVGIANGGLQDGLAEISWAIPALDLSLSLSETQLPRLTTLATSDLSALFQIGISGAALSPLELAIYRNDLQQVRNLVEGHEVGPEAKEASLVLAGSLDRRQALEVLLAAGVNVNARVLDTTALCEAVRRSNVETVKALAKVPGIDPNFTCTMGQWYGGNPIRRTSLQEAVFSRTTDVVAALATIKGINPNVPGFNYPTILSDLVRSHDSTTYEILSILVRLDGIDLNFVDEAGLTPADYAAIFNLALLKPLLDAGARGRRYSNRQLKALITLK